MSSRTLIVNFTFPPYPGIGGRRWAKFAKYLQRNGVEVSIIAAELYLKNPNPWLKDTEAYSSRIAYVKPPYPRVLGTIPSTFIQRIKYKLMLEYVKFKYGKYNYFDPSSGFGNKIKKNIETQIRNGCKNVIVSAGPFHMAAEIGELKTRFPEVNFIIDFRDPWANNRTAFGFQTIGEQSLEFEKKLELEVIKQYDTVIAVSPQLNEYFIERSGEPTSKFITIPNGFDKEDFVNHSFGKPADTGKLRFVFTGTLYSKVLHVIEDFVKSLAWLKSNKPEIYNSFTFDFYGHLPDWFNQVTAPVADCVHKHGELELSQVYQQINDSNICMLFLTDDLTYSRSTKFYEYVAAQKPIAVFSIGGETANFIESNNAGYDCRVGQMASRLEAIYADWKSNNLPSNSTLDISEFDTRELAKKVQQLLK